MIEGRPRKRSRVFLKLLDDRAHYVVSVRHRRTGLTTCRSSRGAGGLDYYTTGWRSRISRQALRRATNRDRAGARPSGSRPWVTLVELWLRMERVEHDAVNNTPHPPRPKWYRIDDDPGWTHIFTWPEDVEA